jgi:hypothetical protein
VFADEQKSNGFKRELYNVELDESIRDKPAQVAVWGYYGDLKARWRTEIFKQRFPSESEYRYTFEEEFECRRALAEQWEGLKKSEARFSDKYLDNLSRAKNSAFFKEYIFSEFREDEWRLQKDSFDLQKYRKWADENLKGPKKETRVKLVKIDLAEW